MMSALGKAISGWPEGLGKVPSGTAAAGVNMRSLHQYGNLQVLAGIPRELHLDSVLQLQAREAGWLQVDGGSAWITRVGDSDDHVLGHGEGMWLGRGEQVVVEPWQMGEALDLHWGTSEEPVGLQPLADLRRAAEVPRPLAGVVRGALARGLARLASAAGRLAAAARSAESIASRAHGSIRPGDSIASSGTLQ
jgi:hypothetical protein